MSSASTSASPAQEPPQRKRVAIIGAGASGLAAIKECREQGLDVVCFEAEPHVGGLWRYVPSKDPTTGEDAHSSVYQSAVMNSSKEMVSLMAYSDFPVPKDWPAFLPHRFVAKYLNMYCDNFNLRKYIKFNRKVVSVSPEIDANGVHSGRWEVVTQKCRRRNAPGTPTGNRNLSPGLRSQSPIYSSSPVDIHRRNLSPARFQRGMSPDSVGFRGRSPAPYDDENNPLMTTPPIHGYDVMPSSPVIKGIAGSPVVGSIPPLDGATTVQFTPNLTGSPSDAFFGGLVGDPRAVSVIKSKAETFDYVIVATGHHWKPRLPEFNGMEKFRGGMMHSHSYRVPYPYKDSRVLIIGVGNSGMDLAAELSYHARQVIMSTRSGTWVLPRFTLFGLPTDHLSSRAASALPRSVLNFATETLMRLQNGNLEKFGLKPGHNLLDAHPTINSEVLDRIGAGKIIVRPNISKFVSGHKVEFEDGTVEDIDHVVYCTGYRIEHPFLDSRAILGQDVSSPPPSPARDVSPAPSSSSTSPGSTNRVRLYKNVFPLNHKNIAFIGLVQPTGAIMPVAEMQARWVSRIFGGVGAPLPPVDEMTKSVEKAMNDLTFVARDRHTVQVDYVNYMDELAEAIGCKPDLWKLWKNQWLLAAQVTFGPAVPFQYRLEGPGKWDGAEDAVGNACAGYDFRKMVGYQAVAKLREDQPKGDNES
ncbi:Cyclopentanone 1,2-monooxygenase (CPMO) [Dinochytrium kinnereticum]|nr:Cyclopentanone 1,2-monooxygenase (CPMO) [Dinochytrium kinnereticum]